MEYCNVYINEKSAMGQGADAAAVEEVLKTLLGSLSLLEGCDKDVVTISKYYSGKLYTAGLSSLHNIQNLTNKDLKRRVKLALKDAKNWEAAPLTDMAATYLHVGVDVGWSSMSEAYERQYPMLVNFMSSSIQETLAEIEKVGVKKISIASFSVSGDLAAWLVSKNWRKQEYDFNSTEAPIDEETILSDSNKFKPTEHRYHGRVMYRRIGTSHLCYVDSKHSGKASHIEEFDEATKKQVCKLRINTDVEYKPLTYNEKRRSLKFDRRK